MSDLGSAPSIVETDLYFFIPKTFELPSFGKPELMKDFRTRMRLALPASGEQGAAALESSLGALRASISRLETTSHSGVPAFEIDHPLSEELLETTKDVCAVISETIKFALSEHPRMLFLSHSLLVTSEACLSGMNNLTNAIRSIGNLMERVRLEAPSANPAATSAFSILDEYISQLYVQYLGVIRTELAQTERPPQVAEAPYEEAWTNLVCALDRLQEKEALHRLRFGSKPAEFESELDRERRLVRLSHLKKFFQSKTFIDISRQQSAKKISESTAAAGTALAAVVGAVVAALIERFISRPEIVNVTFQGLFVIGLGVIVYVLRDRLKDWAKSRFHEKALQFLPDYEQQLMASDRKIGTVKEWFRVINSTSVHRDVAKEVLAVRHSASSTEMEKRLPEDVLHCRRVQDVDSSLLRASAAKGSAGGAGGVFGSGCGGGSFPGLSGRVVHENTRVNFERYLKHMDDPFKILTDLDTRGRFLLSKSHRVYHFYLCIRTVTKPNENHWSKRFRLLDSGSGVTQTQTLIYRIVLDKNGVVRIEDKDL